MATLRAARRIERRVWLSLALAAGSGSTYGDQTGGFADRESHGWFSVALPLGRAISSVVPPGAATGGMFR